MSVALSFNPASPKSLQATVCSVSGLSATTAYTAAVATPQGHTQMAKFTSDGSGNASFPIVPSLAGTYTVTVTPAVNAAAGTGSFNAGGHS